MGSGVREVARLLGMSPNTERDYRRVLLAAGLLEGSVKELPGLEELKAAVMAERAPGGTTPKHEVSSIDAWEGQVQKLLALGLTARPIYDRLRLEEKCFTGSYWSVRRMCRRLKRARGTQAWEVAIPVQTGPGEVAQVDFGYVGKLLCPRSHVLRRAWVFVMTLGFSRHMFAEVVFDQRAETWLALHKRAFAYFGGVGSTVYPRPRPIRRARNRTAVGASRAVCPRPHRVGVGVRVSEKHVGGFMPSGPGGARGSMG